jgi:hypothetical protein
MIRRPQQKKQRWRNSPTLGLSRSQHVSASWALVIMAKYVSGEPAVQFLELGR